MQIFIVEHGEYADHEIVAAFEVEADAQKFATEYNEVVQPSWADRATVGTLDYHPAER